MSADDQDGAVTRSSSRPLLFLIAETGGGHRSAARAVGEALERSHPGRFVPILCDPLGGPDSSRLLRRLAGWYGPMIRMAPWAWAALYHASDSRLAMAVLRRTLLSLVDRPVVDAIAVIQPAMIVSFHPLATQAATRAVRRRRLPVVTVVTDLVTTHAAWRCDAVDRIVVPSATAAQRCRLDGNNQDRCVEIGLPVPSQFCGGPLSPDERGVLRRALGMGERRFVVVLTGGGEGSGGMAKRAAALIEHCDDVDVVAICGRNLRLERRLSPLAARTGNRLRVEGFVHNMAEWLRCADVVVTKAGPGTIAEATCCAAPLLVTSHVPGQEKGNTEFVVEAGAARHARGVRDLVAEIARLRTDPAALDAMRVASARLGYWSAAHDVAALLADLADSTSTTLASTERVPALTGGG